MPTASAPSQFSRRSSTNTHRAAARPDALGAQLEDLRLRLVQADLAGDHDAVEELVEQRAVVAATPPGVRDHAGLDARPAGAAQGLEHRLLGLHAAEEAIDQSFVAVGRDPQQRAELRRERVLVELSGLEPSQQRERLRVLAEELLDQLPVEPLRVAEGAEAVPDVGGEDAAVVDEQPLQAAHALGAGIRLISYAASASRGTPSSKVLSHGSSVVPASTRL